MQNKHIPTPQIHAIDTNSVGDAHSDVLYAGIFQGLPMPIEEALVLANCAGALSTTQRGPATCPSEEAIRKAASSLQ